MCHLPEKGRRLLKGIGELTCTNKLIPNYSHNERNG